MTPILITHHQPPVTTQPIVQITPQTAAWQYVGFAVYRLQTGDTLLLPQAACETAVIVLEGQCEVVAGATPFPQVGKRQSVFDAAIGPEAVYCPPGLSLTVHALTKSEVAVATAPAEKGIGGPRLIQSEDISYEIRGDQATRRFIRNILDENHAAEKLLLVEVVTPPSHWSSFPPHKHDAEILGTEAYLEETYYYRMNPPQGHALQRVYGGSDLNEVVAPGDGDLVLVPHGYHMVASPPGFSTYYLNVMAGPHRVWRYTLDPDYDHIAPRDGKITGQVFKSQAEAEQ